jgi:predicted nucleic acid-binding protein
VTARSRSGLFLDANVLFAAAVSPEGRSDALFRQAAATRTTLMTSPHALEEARRNLLTRYPDAIARLESDLIPRVKLVPEAHPRRVTEALGHGLPLKDAPILAAAIESGSAMLVTGDRRDFGHLYGKVVEGVRIMGLRAALEHLTSS